MAKIGSYIIRLLLLLLLSLLLLLLLLLTHSLFFYRTDRSPNKKYVCDSNFESFLDNTINWFFTSMKDIF